MLLPLLVRRSGLWFLKSCCLCSQIRKQQLVKRMSNSSAHLWSKNESNNVATTAQSYGPHTLPVYPSLYAKNRQRLCDDLSGRFGEGSWVLLEGGKERPRHFSDDTTIDFRQESFFLWAFGVSLPDCYGAIELTSGRSVIFPEFFDPSLSVWMKPTPPAEHFIEHHGLQGCVFWKNKGDVIKFLKENGAQKLLLLQGMNEDSKIKIQHPTFADLKGLMVDTEALHLSMCELRVRKTQEEIRLMRHVSTISTKAHVAVMKQCLPGMMEYQLEALFKYYCMFYGGDRFLAYSAICACAEDNSATLHYHQNSDRLVDGGLCLLDMGCEYFGYVSDITNTFPVNGKFTDKQRGIYLAVKAANEAVQQAAKPGVTYLEMHILANRVLLEELVKLDIVLGNVDEMMEVNLAGYFQPHGLGHMIGYDVHDVGGYTKVTPSRPPKGYGLKNLRTARCLEPGMCITIEPGCYFVDALLDEALDNPDLYKFLNPEVLNSYRGFGGVRIEDCVLITETGVELLSKLPREPEQIELMMAEAAQLNGNFVTPSVMEEPKAL